MKLAWRTNQQFWLSHNAVLYSWCSFSFLPVNHYPKEFNILQKKNTNELGPAWQNIAGNHRIPWQKKIAFSYSDPGDTLETLSRRFVCKRFLPSPPLPSSFIFWFSFHFSRDQNRKSPSTVLFCSETKRKRLLRRLGAPRQSWPIGLQENNNITWIIFLYIILHSAVHMYDIHIFITSSSSFHWLITNQYALLTYGNMPV